MTQGFFRKGIISTGNGCFYTYNTMLTTHYTFKKQQAQAAKRVAEI